jgi:hypothetical protein
MHREPQESRERERELRELRASSWAESELSSRTDIRSTVRYYLEWYCLVDAYSQQTAITSSVSPLSSIIVFTPFITCGTFDCRLFRIQLRLSIAVSLIDRYLDYWLSF